MNQKENIPILQKRASLIIYALKKLFPNAKMALKYSNNWELLVAVMLSAQCTDKQVNIVTENLFKKYRTLESYTNARLSDFEKDIYSTGFYKSKAKHILASAQIIQEKYAGVLPRTMNEMLALPGVARKTANVVLGNAYGVVEGIAVDTHVKRLVYVFGLSKETDPKKIEQDLMLIVPKKDWFQFTYLCIEYGRAYCTARKHDHEACPLTRILESESRA
jgi:endonuclease-3